MFWKYEKSDSIYFKKVKKSNNSTAIIFIHGLGGSRNYWKEMQTSMTYKFVLYFIDLLGFGFSKKPDVEYTLDFHINAIHTFIRDHVKEKNIFIVGHSLGAIIALGYTAKYPTNIVKTYLVSLPYYHGSDEAKKYISTHTSLPFLFSDTPLAHISCHIACMFRPFFLFTISLLAGKRSQLIKEALYHTHKSYFSTLKNVVMQQEEILNYFIWILRQLEKKDYFIPETKEKLMKLKPI